MRKFRIFAWIMAVLLVFASIDFVDASASNTEFRNNADFLQDCSASADGYALNIMVASMEENVPAVGSFDIMLDSNPLQILGMKTTEDTPITYYCLVDVSGSVSKEQMEQQVNVLCSIRSQLKEGDKMLIARMGNDITPSAYMTDEDEIDAEINALEITHEDTNLYHGISAGINSLISDPNVSGRRCFIVMSDGENYQQNGKSKDEADRMVRESKVPVYTVALMNKRSLKDKYWMDMADDLGHFATESAGGLALNPSLDKKIKDGATEIAADPASYAGNLIVEDMHKDVILTADLGDFEPDREEMLLTVQYTTADGSNYGDTMTVYKRNMPEKPTPTPEPTAEPIQEPTSEPEPTEEAEPETAQEVADTTENSDEGSSVPIWVWIAIGAFLLIIIIVIILFLSKKKKKREEEERIAREAAEAAQAVDEIGVTRDVSVDSIGTTGNVPVSEIPQSALNSSELSKPAGPVGKMVIFTAIGHENVRFALDLEEGKEYTVGRDGRADRILNPNDKQLSGINSRFMLRGNALHVQDADSTNGTSVNGVPIQKGATSIVNNGGTIRLGSYEYRVQI